MKKLFITLTGNLVIQVISVFFLVSIVGILLVTLLDCSHPKTNGQGYNHVINNYFRSESYSNNFSTLNEFGITKISCFTVGSKAHTLSCYLGSNISTKAETNLNADGVSNYNVVSGSPSYLVTVDSQGRISNDCVNLSDSAKIMSVSSKQSWLQVYLKGSILGDKHQDGQLPVFLMDRTKSGALPIKETILDFKNILKSAIKYVSEDAQLKASSCLLAVY
ncbi:hypothetical protein [Photobacterium damselae]|uniref:hypothetical protein n=1 Tax=Photobacterium damselae TaxID=38293 RepID=UPI001F256506|nr:hypothetical protein [Photobacterium damselae]UKA04542.1 hypothetical protein IHC89_23250 [Photobacterium damselae subsp. damselae]